MAKDYRSPDRGTGVTFRMSRQQRDRLHRDAARRGYTVQQYLEALAFGEATPTRRPGKAPRDQELPMTG